MNPIKLELAILQDEKRSASDLMKHLKKTGESNTTAYKNIRSFRNKLHLQINQLEDKLSKGKK